VGRAYSWEVGKKKRGKLVESCETAMGPKEREKKMMWVNISEGFVLPEKHIQPKASFLISARESLNLSSQPPEEVKSTA